MRRTKWCSAELVRLAYQHSLLGNKWAMLAKVFHKTDAQVKNIFHSVGRSKSGCNKCAILHYYVKGLRGCADDPEARRAALLQAKRLAQQSLLQAAAQESEQALPRAGPAALGSTVTGNDAAQALSVDDELFPSESSSYATTGDGTVDCCEIDGQGPLAIGGDAHIHDEVQSPGNGAADGSRMRLRTFDTLASPFTLTDSSPEPGGTASASLSAAGAGGTAFANNANAGAIPRTAAPAAPAAAGVGTVACPHEQTALEPSDTQSGMGAAAPAVVPKYSPSRDPLLLLRARATSDLGARPLSKASTRQENSICTKMVCLTESLRPAPEPSSPRLAQPAPVPPTIASNTSGDAWALDDMSPFVAVAYTAGAVDCCGAAEQAAGHWQGRSCFTGFSAGTYSSDVGAASATLVDAFLSSRDLQQRSMPEPPGRIMTQAQVAALAPAGVALPQPDGAPRQIAPPLSSGPAESDILLYNLLEDLLQEPAEEPAGAFAGSVYASCQSAFDNAQVFCRRGAPLHCAPQEAAGCSHMYAAGRPGSMAAVPQLGASTDWAHWQGAPYGTAMERTSLPSCHSAPPAVLASPLLAAPGDVNSCRPTVPPSMYMAHTPPLLNLGMSAPAPISNSVFPSGANAVCWAPTAVPLPASRSVPQQGQRQGHACWQQRGQQLQGAQSASAALSRSCSVLVSDTSVQDGGSGQQYVSRSLLVPGATTISGWTATGSMQMPQGPFAMSAPAPGHNFAFEIRQQAVMPAALPHVQTAAAMEWAPGASHRLPPQVGQWQEPSSSLWHQPYPQRGCSASGSGLYN